MAKTGEKTVKHPGEDSTLCPVHATIDMLSRRWTLHIVRALLQGTKRFNQLSRELGVNPRTLKSRLSLLEHDGVVQRIVVCAMPPMVEYRLTKKGMELHEIIEHISLWGQAWAAGIPSGEESRP